MFRNVMHFLSGIVFLLGVMALAASPTFAQQNTSPGLANVTLAPVLLSSQTHEIQVEPKSIFVIPDGARKYQFNSIINLTQTGQILTFASQDQIVSLGAEGEPTWVVIPVFNKSDHEIWSFNFGSSQNGRLSFAQKAILYEPTSGQALFNTTTANTPGYSGSYLSTDVPIVLKREVVSYLIFYFEGRKGSLTTFKPSFHSNNDNNTNIEIFSPHAKSFFLAAIFILTTGFFFSRDYSLLVLSFMWLLFFLYRSFLDQYFLIDTFFSQIVGPAYRLAVPILLFNSLWLRPLIKDKYPLALYLGTNIIFLACGFMGMILPASAPTLGIIFSYAPTIGICIIVALLSCPLAKSQPRENFSGLALISLTLLVTSLWSFVETIHPINSLDLLLDIAPWLTAVVSVLSSLLQLRYTESIVTYKPSLNLSNEIDVSDASIREARENSEHARLLQVLEQERQMMKLMQMQEARQTEEMKRAKESADEANTAKSAFLAVVSHEIRTPMTGIMGMVRLILDTGLSREQKEYANTIQDSGEALLSLLNDILDFEKIESGKLELEKTSFDLRRLLKGIHTLMNGHAASKNVELLLDIDNTLPEFVIGDPTRLRQVLLNLVGNAIKFTSRGAVTLHIKNLSDPDNVKNPYTQIYFGIQDSGIGISPEAQKKIFTPFAQADASINRKFGGTGLGLTICKRLIDAMGSSIGINSREGEGSTFFFTLQMQISKAEDRDMKLAVAYDKNIKKLCVLVVDDNGINQKVIQSLLNKGGHQSIVASNVDDAMNELSKNYFDLVLMDIELPGKNGVEGTKLIRNLPDIALAEIPVVAMTGNVASEDIRSYLNNDMNDFIAKPVMPENLNKILYKTANGDYAQVKVAPILKETVIDVTDLKQILSSEKDEEDVFASAVRDFEAAEIHPGSTSIDEKIIASLIKSLGKNQTRELMKDFYVKAEEIIHDISQAARTHNGDDLRARAHELKGMAANFGAKSIADISAELEKNAQTSPQSDLQTLSDKLSTLYKTSVSEINNRLMTS